MRTAQRKYQNKPIGIGLKTATPEEIAGYKRKYPNGVHSTHKKTGDKLPYNGVFYCNCKSSVNSRNNSCELSKN